MPTKRETFKFTGVLPADRGLNREAGEAWVTITMSENLVRNTAGDRRETIVTSLKRKLRDVCTIPMLMEGETVITPEVQQDFSCFPDDGVIRVNRSGLQIVMGKSDGYPEICWWVVRDDVWRPTFGSIEHRSNNGTFFVKIRDGELVHTSPRIDDLSQTELSQVNQLIQEAKLRGRTSEFTRIQWDNWWAARWRLQIEII